MSDDDPGTGPDCPDCGCEMQWENCDNCGGDGYHDDLHEYDPLWYPPGATARCDWCEGKGGWRLCFERECREKRGARVEVAS